MTVPRHVRSIPPQRARGRYRFVALVAALGLVSTMAVGATAATLVPEGESTSVSADAVVPDVAAVGGAETAEQSGAEVPESAAPAVEVPSVEGPVAEVPSGEVPVVEVPAVEAPAVEAPAVEAPAENVQPLVAEQPATVRFACPF